MVYGAAMPLIKDTPIAADKKHARVQTAAWVCIYGGLLVLLTGITTARTEVGLGWALGLIGSLATAVGAALIYIRSRMK